MAKAIKKKNEYLSPSTIQISGYVLIVAFLVMWYVTGTQSALLIGVAASFVLLGRARDAGDELAKKLGYTRESGKYDEGKHDEGKDGNRDE